MRRRLNAITVWTKKRVKTIGGLGAGVIVGVAGTAVVVATIPDGGGVIHACYRTSGGQAGSLRVIDSPTQACTSNEAALSWNQTGPQGPPGQSGGGPGQFKANLVGVRFQSSDLSNRAFSGADLHGSTFLTTNMIGGEFGGANFSGSTFDGGYMLRNGTFDGADFSGATFRYASLFNPDYMGLANFNNADFSGVSFVPTQGGFSRLSFQGSTFQGADFTGATASGWFISPNYNGATLTNVVFAGLQLESASFVGVTTVAGADFSGAQFNSSTLLGADFSGTTITGATWSNTICPDGTNSNNNGNTCAGHLTP